MAQQNIGAGRLDQRTAGAKLNSNFTELYTRNPLVEIVAANANTTFVVPAGHQIEHIAFFNTTANAVSGGVKIGQTNGGTEVVAAQAVGANALGTVAGADVLKRVFSTTAATTLYVQAVTSWASANVQFKITTRKMF